MRARNSRAQCVDFRDGAVHDRQNEIKVMDHQIENDRNIRPAGFVWSNAGCLNVEGRLDPFGDGVMFGGVAQQVSDLKDFSGLFGQFSEGICLVQRRGDGFLDQNVSPGSESLTGQRKMIFRRGRDNDGIDLFKKIFVACGNSATNFCCHNGCAGWIGVIKSDKLFGRVCCGFEGVKPSEMTGPDDTDTKLLRCIHAGTLIRRAVFREGRAGAKRQKVASAWRKRHGPGQKMI